MLIQHKLTDMKYIIPLDVPIIKLAKEPINMNK